MTIKDIAREAGYAVGTVSRVLNEQPDVSPAAREKILAVVRAHNFVPNANARHLKQQLNSGVAIIVKGTSNMLFAGVVELLQEKIRENGLRAYVSYIDETGDEVEQAVRFCRERKPLGILFLGSYLPHFERRFDALSVPCVLVTNSAASLGLARLSSVTTNDVAAAAACVEYLADRGHRVIGVLGGDVNGSQASSDRLAGCETAFARRGIPFDRSTQYTAARFSLAGGYAAMGHLLETLPGMTAVFAFSDIMALGALRLLHERGYRVPEDISLVGFDGLELAQYSVPRLTTVRQNQKLLAERSFDILLSRIQGGCGAVHETLPFTLVEGESVCTLQTN